MTMRHLLRSRVIPCWLCLLSSVAYSQVRTSEFRCIATNQGSNGLTWWNGPASGRPDATELASVFGGRFDIVEVQTEGGERHLRRWQLALVPADTAAQRCGPTICGPTGRPSGPIYPLHGALLATGVVWDSARARRGESFGQSDAWIRLEEHPLTLTLAIGPPRTFDVGAYYQIREVNGPSGAAFAGRWGDGGIGMMIMTIDSVNLGEQVGGYFCATRVP